MPTNRLLLIKLSALGDVIQTLPTLEALREAFPTAEITWLVEEAAAPLLQYHPALDTLLISRRQAWLRAARTWRQWPVVWSEVRQLLMELRRRPFTAVVDLQGLGKSALWTWLARSPRKLGFAGTREYSYLALNERLPPYDPDEHAVRRYLRLAQHLGATSPNLRFRVALPLGAGDQLQEIWQEAAGPVIVLHPGTRWPSKQWPTMSLARLADALARDFQARVVFTGSRGDKPLIAQCQAAMQTRALDLSGRTDLWDLTRLFFHVDAAVTTDTGPMHLAAAVGTPVVAVFGPTAPWRTGPCGRQHRVVYTGAPCSPCRQRQCPDPLCLSQLPMEAVLAAVRAVLQQDQPPRHRSFVRWCEARRLR